LQNRFTEDFKSAIYPGVEYIYGNIMSSFKKMTEYFSRTQEFLFASWENYKVKTGSRAEKEMSKSDYITILFADIVRSSEIYNVLGDKNAQKLISACLFLLSEVTAHHEGKVIKTIGDEVLCTFSSADTAVKAAKAMHLAVGKIKIPVRENTGLFPPSIRIGIHSGEVICEGNDVFGDAVNVAARMVGLAKQRQIITTEQTVMSLSPEYQSMSRCIDRTTIKGKRGELNIHELIWEKDATAELDNSFISLALKNLKACLELRFQDQVIRIDQNRPSVTIGRDAYNDLVVEGKRVSRTHACIEYRRGRFVLIDRSTNGTYLLSNGKPSIVRRTESPLHGTGLIGLSQKVTERSPDVISYSVKP